MVDNYCTNCGNYLNFGDNFCSKCGKNCGFRPMPMTNFSLSGTRTYPKCNGTGEIDKRPDLSDFEKAMYALCTLGIGPLSEGGFEKQCDMCDGTGEI